MKVKYRQVQKAGWTGLRAYSVVAIVIVTSTFLTTGCWDMVEPNQRSLWVGSAVDATPNGRVKLSGQILVPSAISAQGKSSPGSHMDIVESAVGSNISDAMENLQKQVSRKTYLAHRLSWFVGEPMAKRGFRDLLDEFGRNPDSNLRAYVLVVKGGTGDQLLTDHAALEATTTLSAVRTVRFGNFKESTANLRFFAAESLKDGQRPLALAIDRRMTSAAESESSADESSRTKQSFSVRDIALFDKNVRLVGYLEGQDADIAGWVTNLLQRDTLTQYMPKGHGYVTLKLQHVHRRVHSQLLQRGIVVHVRLSGAGMIIENNSSLDLSAPQNMQYVEHQFEQNTVQQANRVIAKVQRDYGTDVFGFGEDVHRRHPYEWRRLKSQWDAQFKQVKVDVGVKLSIRHQGQKGPSYVGPIAANPIPSQFEK